MWLMTNFGFFSVVQKPGDELLTVRTRVKKDLEMLREKYIPGLGEIIDTPKADYQFRTRVQKEVFAEAMRKVALDISYDNFKNSVVKVQGSKRAHIYHDVWSTLWDLKDIK